MIVQNAIRVIYLKCIWQIFLFAWSNLHEMHCRLAVPKRKIVLPVGSKTARRKDLGLDEPWRQNQNVLTRNKQTELNYKTELLSWVARKPKMTAATFLSKSRVRLFWFWRHDSSCPRSFLRAVFDRTGSEISRAWTAKTWWKQRLNFFSDVQISIPRRFDWAIKKILSYTL